MNGGDRFGYILTDYTIFCPPSAGNYMTSAGNYMMKDLI